MDKETNSLEQIAKFITPFISFIIFLLGYVWTRQNREISNRLLENEGEIKRLWARQDEIINSIHREVNILLNRIQKIELTELDEAGKIKEELRGMKTDLIYIKKTLEIRYGQNS